MYHSAALALLLFGPAMVATGSASGNTAVPVAEVSPGQTAATPSAAGLTAYHNDTLRLSYAYPGNYIDASGMVTPAFEASVGQDPDAAPVAKCLSLPFSRMQPDKKVVGLVLMIRADAACFKKHFNAKSVTELAQGEAKGLAASGAKTNLGAPVNFSVAGRPASMVGGDFALPTGQSLQARVVCVLDQPDVVCWQFLAGNLDQMKTMGTFPVTFDGAPPTALIPASLSGKP